MVEPQDAPDDGVPDIVLDWLDALAMNLIAKGKRVAPDVMDDLVAQGYAVRREDGTQALTRLGERMNEAAVKAGGPGKSIQLPGPFPPPPDGI